MLNLGKENQLSSNFDQIYNAQMKTPVSLRKAFYFNIAQLWSRALGNFIEIFTHKDLSQRGSEISSADMKGFAVMSLAFVAEGKINTSADNVDPLAEQLVQLKKALITEVKERVFFTGDKENLQKMESRSDEFSAFIDKKNALLIEALDLKGRAHLACIACKDQLRSSTGLSLLPEEIIDLWVTTFVDEMFAGESQDALEKQLNRAFSKEMLKKRVEAVEKIAPNESIGHRLKNLWDSLFAKKDKTDPVHEVIKIASKDLQSYFSNIVKFNKKIHDIISKVDGKTVLQLQSKIENESRERKRMEQEDRLCRELKERKTSHIASLNILFSSQKAGALPENLPNSVEFVADTIKERDTLVKKYLEQYEENKKTGNLSEKEENNYFATICYLLQPEKKITNILTFCAEQSRWDVLALFLENDKSLFNSIDDIRKLRSALSSHPTKDKVRILDVLDKRVAFFNARNTFNEALIQQSPCESILEDFTHMEELFEACDGTRLCGSGIKEIVLKQIGDTITGQVSSEVKRYNQTVLHVLLDPIHQGKKVLEVCSQDRNKIQLLYQLDQEFVDLELQAIKERIQESHSRNIINKKDLDLFKNIIFHLSDTNIEPPMKIRYDTLKPFYKAVLDGDIETVDFLLHMDPECFSSKCLPLMEKCKTLNAKLQDEIMLQLERQIRLVKKCGVDVSLDVQAGQNLIYQITSGYIDKSSIKEALEGKKNEGDLKALSVFLMTVCHKKLVSEKNEIVKGNIVNSLRHLIDLDHEGETAFAQALLQGDTENSRILWELDKERCYNDIRHFISLEKNKEKIESLIASVKQKIAPEWVDNTEGPLWILITRGDLSSVKFLLDCDSHCSKEVVKKMLTIPDIQLDVKKLLEQKLKEFNKDSSMFSKLTNWKKNRK